MSCSKHTTATSEVLTAQKRKLLAKVNDGVASKRAVFTGPFGKKTVIHCDYTASGKPLQFIEDIIRRHVLPFYSNTHTSSNISAKQTAQFRADARKIIKECVNAGENDVVVFTGSGCTAAIHKLIPVMGCHGDRAKKTVVLIGPYEHHSNILPWRESGATCERITENSVGLPDLGKLEERLQHYENLGYHLIVAMSAASNVTGTVTNTDDVAKLAHKYDALAIFDYAAGAPYLEINMNSTGDAYKDAIVISPHKFVGGVGTPGILIAKKKLFKNKVPHGCGGGTVAYVTTETQNYVEDIEEREEGGTPAIMESIRAGLVFNLKRTIGEDVIDEQEELYARKAFEQWAKNPNIYILGCHTVKRIPIFPLVIYNPESGKLLHSNFVCKLLSDLYGIQARPGTACAGPYAIELLSVGEDFMDFLLPLLGERGRCNSETCRATQQGPLGIMQFGFARLNFPYFIDEATADYVLHAVDMVATHAWELLPLYTYNPENGEWHHRENGDPSVYHLTDFNLATGDVDTDERHVTLQEIGDVTLQQMKLDADKVLKSVRQLSLEANVSKDPELPLGPDEIKNIWFLLPKEAQSLLFRQQTEQLHLTPFSESQLPFSVKQYGNEMSSPRTPPCDCSMECASVCR